MKRIALIAAGLALTFTTSARADLATFYVGVDTGSGSNQGHLTFLRAHGDHFHRLGVFGGAEGRIPESYVGGQLSLFDGTGVFDDRFVSGPYETPGSEVGGYSDLEIRPISGLLGFPANSPETILINGGQRYLGDLSGSILALELVSISSGLGLYDASGNLLVSNPGDRHTLGAADSFIPFLPIFATDAGAAFGTAYSATFRLVDLNGVVPQSGTFRYEFRSVPEPGSLALMGLGMGLGTIAAIRRRKGMKAASA